MLGPKKNTPASPAHWVAGQRRKLVRRNLSNPGQPRSKTMPVLNQSSAPAALIDSVNIREPEYTESDHTAVTHRQYLPSDAQRIGTLEDPMYFSSQGNAIKYVQIISRPPHLTSLDLALQTLPPHMVQQDPHLGSQPTITREGRAFLATRSPLRSTVPHSKCIRRHYRFPHRLKLSNSLASKQVLRWLAVHEILDPTMMT